jgi:plasmid stabilization system protein ParE
LRPGTRRLIVGNYIVSYRRRGEDVEIFAVRYSRRSDARF